MPANFEPVSERQLPNQGHANSDSGVRWVTEEKLLWKSSLCRPSTGLAAVPRTITCTCTRFTRSLKVLPVSVVKRSPEGSHAKRNTDSNGTQSGHACTDTSVLLGYEVGVSAADFCWSGFLRALSARRSSRQKQNHVACPKAGAIERVETNAMFRLQRSVKVQLLSRPFRSHRNYTI
jgi:hypothetical protein